MTTTNDPGIVTDEAAAAKPWYAAYPEPRTVTSSITRQTLLSWMKKGEKLAGKDYVLVDLRRTDYEVSDLVLLFTPDTCYCLLDIPSYPTPDDKLKWYS